MPYRLWISVLMLVAGAGLFVAAGLADPARKGGTLRIGRVLDLGSVDTGIGGGPDFETCAKLFNFPDKPAPEGTQVIPEVAKGFPKVSKDGKTQTIQLRRDFSFHTGARITAASFVAALNRDANPKLESESGARLYLSEIVGADAVIEGKARTISGVRTRGRYTLEIRTTRPVVDLPARLTLVFFCPVPPGTPPVEIDNLPGSGPYYVASRVPNRQIVLERNRFYRGSRPANVNRIVWTFGVGQEACWVAIERDELDTCEIPATAVPEIAERYGINKGRFFFYPTFVTSFFAFNHDRPAFKGVGQIPLKQAINWALDRPALVRAPGLLVGKRTDQILPPTLTRQERIYPLEGVTESNLARARALLAKARIKPEKLVLYVTNGPGSVPRAQIFRFNLKRLGIDVEIKYFSFPTLIERAGTRGEPFDVVLSAWNLDYAEPITFFRPLLYGGTIGAAANTNFAYFNRPKYNREIDRIDRMTDAAARRKAWADLDVDMMRNDPPWAPFMNGASRIFVSKSFGCFVFQPVIGVIDLVAACKK